MEEDFFQYLVDQPMGDALFYCYRWFLVNFKRGNLYTCRYDMGLRLLSLRICLWGYLFALGDFLVIQVVRNAALRAVHRTGHLAAIQVRSHDSHVKLEHSLQRLSWVWLPNISVLHASLLDISISTHHQTNTMTGHVSSSNRFQCHSNYPYSSEKSNTHWTYSSRHYSVQCTVFVWWCGKLDILYP